MTRGLLLGHAVERAKAPDEVDAVDADDFAVGKDLGEDVEGHAVVGIVKGRHRTRPLAMIEIGVAGRQALACERQRGAAGAVRRW